MNYIKIMNRFWRLRKRQPIKSTTADVFYHLVEECNRRRWENPLAINNGVLCDLTGISLSTLKRCRAKLIANGAIGYQSGSLAEAAPLYKLYEDDDSYNADENWRDQVHDPGHEPDQEAVHQRPHYTKRSKLLNGKTFALSSERQSAGEGDFFEDERSGSRPADDPEKEKSCAQKEKDFKERKVPYWRPIVSRWFSFCLEKLEIKVSFRGQDPKCLKEIMLMLQDNCALEWTEVQALKTFEDYLRSAWQDTKFLRGKFLLKNLLDQHDAIVANQRSGAWTRSDAKTAVPAERPSPKKTTTAQAPVIRHQDMNPAANVISFEDWQQMIEEDYKLTLADQANMIMLTGVKYVFLRKAGLIRFKTRDLWFQNYVYAMQLMKPKTTAEAVAEMRKLVYLAFLRRAAERQKPAIFSHQITTDQDGKEPGSAGDTAGANDQSTVQSLRRQAAQLYA